jgi:hypothetical protein
VEGILLILFLCFHEVGVTFSFHPRLASRHLPTTAWALSVTVTCCTMQDSANETLKQAGLPKRF